MKLKASRQNHKKLYDMLQSQKIINLDKDKGDAEDVTRPSKRTRANMKKKTEDPKEPKEDSILQNLQKLEELEN